MATNFVEPGASLPFTAPSGGVVSGGAYVIGSLLVIATHEAAEAAVFLGAIGGVWDVPKDAGDDWEEGDPIYFDPDTSPSPIFTTDISSPALTLVGVAIQNSVAEATTGRVRLDGAAR